MPRTPHAHGYHGVCARTGGWVALLAIGLAVGLVACAGSPEQATPFAYITNSNADSVSVLDIVSNTVVGAPIAVGASPVGVAVHPAGTRVYVINFTANSVSVIDTATHSVTATIPVGLAPVAFGQFISPGAALPH
jgi:YVTN family beta-propeller protein